MGGGSGSTPTFQLPDIGKNLASMGGGELEAYARNMLRNGLDPKQRAMLEGSAAGSLRSGEQNQREMFASMGNAPVAAQVGAQTNLRSGVNKNLLNALTEGDINAKQQGFQNWTNLGQMAMGISGGQNQYNLGSYQADQEARAGKAGSTGNMIGSGLAAGGTIAAAL